MTSGLRAGRDGPTMPEGKGYQMRGEGATVVSVSPEDLWAIVTDERRLAAAIPGADTLHRVGEGMPRAYAADVGIGVGPVKGTYHVTAEFAEEEPPAALVLFGGAKGPFGHSSGEGWVDFRSVDGGTEVVYSYAILISGTVARLGGRLLDAAANKLIAKFFARLAKAIEADRVVAR
ncbi:SRPBCC family protein [Acuticoccus mangrovi]|uniref:Carbon monoxide dehydrogenase subunit G n=1 Tax=Acuticoccus mangrovi TaxID=2796142 RepID=A0A934IKB3_9HYPH|nr:carbon monoxide dehydrogenase subunit G [Acuticoccus mangrovi]MBJ3778234.1 carbon monoxide dehydrogenase subunit G [Acuticoccus mangrovi]